MEHKKTAWGWFAATGERNNMSCHFACQTPDIESVYIISKLLYPQQQIEQIQTNYFYSSYVILRHHVPKLFLLK